MEKRFESIRSLQDYIGSLRSEIQNKRQEQSGYISPPVFRGHARSSWKLETTLERAGYPNFSAYAYNSILKRVGPAIEAHTTKNWTLDSLDGKLLQCDSVSNYGFMAFLRHHGFPSPLLDWSKSLYVALFFAYQNASHDEDVAVFIYLSHVGSERGANASPGLKIIPLGHYVSTHKRHFVQQGQYTIAVDDGQQLSADYKSNFFIPDEAKNDFIYCSHSAVGGNGNDHIEKVVLPGHIKDEVNNMLREANINEYTIYGGTDALVKALWEQEHGRLKQY